MKLLLDTHAFLWWLADDARLSKRARKAIADPEQAVYLSSASAWEIATKHRIGRLADALAGPRADRDHGCSRAVTERRCGRAPLEPEGPQR